MLRCAQPLPGTSWTHSTADEQLIEAAIASGPSNGHMTIYDARSYLAATANRFQVGNNLHSVGFVEVGLISTAKKYSMSF